MSRRIPLRGLAIVAGLALALPLWAKPLKKSIEFISPARVGDAVLLAGRYELIVNDKITTFEKDDKVVAEIPCQWVRIAKSPTDAMVFDKDQLSEIEFAGKSVALEFTDNSASAPPTPSRLGNN